MIINNLSYIFLINLGRTELKMITKTFIPSSSVGCGHWEISNSNGSIISADDNDVDIKEAVEELEKEGNEE